MNLEQARFNMIEQQIRPWEVLDQAVLSLLSMVHREDFVPADCRALAFVDTEVPLADGQFMLAPKLEARLLQETRVQKHESVLEIGTGSGYMAALLAHRAQSVTTMEIRPALARMARDNLRRAGLHTVQVLQADGSSGLVDEAPFDVIVLSGSVAEVPPALLAQLKPGGRLVGVIGQEPVMRAEVVQRAADGSFAHSVLFDTIAPRLDGFAQPSRFQF